VKRSMIIPALAALVLAATAACGGSSSSGPPRLNWYVFDEPSGAYRDAVANCNKAANGEYTINLVPLPTNSDQQRELIVRRLAAKDSTVDIIGMDVIWTAEFASARWILPWKGDSASQATAGTLEGPLRSAQFKDQLWAAPFTSNTQLLWYRKDRVSTPPTTWAEMLADAKQIGSDGKIEEQGARYEGLVVWFNALVASAGGQIVDQNGDVVLGQPAVKALETLKAVASSPEADPSLSNSREDDGRLAFQAGGASFMVNWPYVYASAQTLAATDPGVKKVFDNMAWTKYPAIDSSHPSAPPLGGINLGIGAYTKHADLAFKAALCLRGPENQVIATQKGGLPPTIDALYSDPRIQKAYPFADVLRESLKDAAPRPTSPAYSDISLAIQDTIHPPASIDPAKTADQLRKNIEKVANGGLL
jgi:multiple sugar transport system substrate-binding protein